MKKIRIEILFWRLKGVKNKLSLIEVNTSENFKIANELACNLYKKQYKILKKLSELLKA